MFPSFGADCSAAISSGATVFKFIFVRLRFTNFPLQAYGALFKWDLLVEDVLEVYRAPWRMVPSPSIDEQLLIAQRIFFVILSRFVYLGN